MQLRLFIRPADQFERAERHTEITEYLLSIDGVSEVHPLTDSAYLDVTIDESRIDQDQLLRKAQHAPVHAQKVRPVF